MYHLRLYTLCFVIFIYLFGVILFSTFSVHDGTRYGGSHGRGRAMEMSGVPSRKVQYTIKWCQPLHYIEDPGNRPVVGLVSFPGSGNTWLRYLLQQATGIYTGSIYMDYGLFKNGFPAELVTNNSVSVVKTHEWGHDARSKFHKIVLLIRSPGDAIVAEFNRRSAGHIGYASADRFTYGHGRYWHQFFYSQLNKWKIMTLDWVNNFPGPIHIITYEDLVSNLPHTLMSIIRFLDISISPDELECAVVMREGIYRRKKRKKKFDPFSKHMKAQLKYEWDNIFNQINSIIDNNSSSYL